MTAAAGSMAAGRQVWQAVAESLHFETQSGDEMLRWHGPLKPQSPPPAIYLLQQVRVS